MVARDASRGGGGYFGDDGDLDGDGISNADEYDIVVGAGGDIEEFAEAVLMAALVLGFIVTALAFMGLLAVGVLNAETRRKHS